MKPELPLKVTLFQWQFVSTRNIHAPLMPVAAFYRQFSQVDAAYFIQRFVYMRPKILFDRDTNKCFDKDITKDLDKNHNKSINTCKAKLINKHKNKSIDKYKTKYINKYIIQPLPQVQPSHAWY